MQVARYGRCETFTSADNGALERWRASSILSSHSKNCTHRFCDLSDTLYPYDRCWNRRTICSLHLAGALHAPLLVGQEQAPPAGSELRAGQYVVILGPAAALGVASRTSFAEMLRAKLRGRTPIVNLGRGGTGPADYLHALSVGGMTPLLANAAAVVVVLMSGRSSANSLAGPEVRAMVRASMVARVERRDAHKAALLRNESLDTAARDYAALGSALRADAAARDAAPPAIIVMWFSECSLQPEAPRNAWNGGRRGVAAPGGCRHVDAFPCAPADHTRAHTTRVHGSCWCYLQAQLCACLRDGVWLPSF